MTAQDHTDRLGPYRLLERLGEGGMGVVYLATDPNQRQVAVKALRPVIAADPNARRRLAREVETMRRVRSPFVAEVLDADVTSVRPLTYLVTMYGGSLVTSASRTSATNGLRTRRMVSTSRASRRRAFGSAAIAGRSALTATLRWFGSVAR